MDGIIAVNKPKGWTSHDVVARARRLFGTKRIGHTGTLDPQVTGVLPLCIGRATRLVEYIQELPKAYEAVMEFGYATDSEDATGVVIERLEQVTLDEHSVLAAISSFVGEIEQIPPMYSAVKVNGKRLYELARQGEVVERKPRSATIYGIDVLEVNLVSPYPSVRFRVSCSKGTYIRTLCVDIGRKLELPAVMTQLVRTATGPFTLEDCRSLEDIEAAAAAGTVEQLLQPLDAGVSHLRRIEFPSADVLAALTGKHMPLDWFSPQMESVEQDELIRLYHPNGMFLGLYTVNLNSSTMIPEKVFATP